MAYKAISVPTFQTLVPHRLALAGMWSDMLAHQLPVLPPLNDFWDALPEIFDWMMSAAPIPQRAVIHRDPGEVDIRTRLLPIGVPVLTPGGLLVRGIRSSPSLGAFLLVSSIWLFAWLEVVGTVKTEA
jgi:hypothetical protein